MVGKLTAKKVETAKLGKYSDGGNLYSIISQSLVRKWILRFTWRGRPKEIGLGSANSVALLMPGRKQPKLARKSPGHYSD